MVIRNLLITSLLALLCSSPTFAVDSSEVTTAVFNSTGLVLSPQAERNISDYITRSSNPVIQEGLLCLLEKDRREDLQRLRKSARRIRIDGMVRDWNTADFETRDTFDEWYPVNPDKPIRRKRRDFDIVSYGFAVTNDYVHVMLKPRSMPRGKKHHHAVNFMNSSGRLYYAIAWSEYGFHVHEYNPEDNSYVRSFRPRGMKNAAGRVFEAKVPRRSMKNLPEYFHVGSIAWDKEYNAYNNMWPYTPHSSLEEKYRNYGLELFARYSESAVFIPDNPVPIAQALADAYIYRMSRNSVRPLVVSDGLRMLEEAAKSDAWAFPGQKKLTEHRLNQIIEWSNRASLYGIENNSWKFRSVLSPHGEKFSEASYRFLFLDPAVLDDARTLITQYDLIVPGDLPATLRKIEETAVNTQRYRAGLAFLEMLSRVLGTAYWQKIYEDAKYEEDNNLTVITEIDDVPIHKYSNWSASFQVRYLRDNNTHFGNCGDVTTMSLAVAKALGIPAIHIHYDLAGDNYHQVIHSFPAYYSSAEGRYIGFRKGDNHAWDWAKSGREDLKVIYFYDSPIHEWFSQFQIRPFTGTKVWRSSNSDSYTASLEQWQIMNAGGFPAP